jgi:hypothetical protein
MVDSRHRAAVYRGLAEATDADGPAYLYAADFHNGRVDVFDSRWQRLSRKRLRRPQDARLVRALRDPGDRKPGVRHVRVARTGERERLADRRLRRRLQPQGKLLARVARRGPLNQPVDVALAPPTFGKFGGDLLVGNFGDGRIGVYRELRAGRWGYLGALRTPDQRIIEINGIWGLEFGNGGAAGPKDTLYFTAGPHTWRGETVDGVRGLFGSIRAAG